MKTKILSILLTVAAMIGFCACDNGLDPQPQAQGQLKLSSMAVEVDEAENVISRAGVNTDNFIVVIKNTAGEIRGKYSFAEMPEIISLPVGDYTIDVNSHELQKAEWDKPYYSGRKEFKITDGNITEIGTVTCKFASLKVSVAYTADLKEAMGADCRVTVVANDEGRLEYLPDENRIGCFAVIEGSNTLVASFTGTVKGSEIHTNKIFNTVAPGQHYKITFGIKNGNPTLPEETGEIALGDITVDLSVIDENVNGNVDDEEDIIPDPTRPGTDPVKPGEPGGDGPDDPKPPVEQQTITIKSDDVKFNEDEDYAGPNSCAINQCVVTIGSEVGLTHLKVKIETTNDGFRNEVGNMLPFDFDLAEPGNDAESFTTLGFPVGNDVIGQKEVTFDISTFVPLLPLFPGTHTFTLTVMDSKNTLVRTLTFVAQ